MDPYADEINNQLDCFVFDVNKKVEKLREFFLDESSASNARVFNLSSRLSSAEKKLSLAEKNEMEAKAELANTRKQISTMEKEIKDRDDIIRSFRMHKVYMPSPLRCAYSPPPAASTRSATFVAPSLAPSPPSSLKRSRQERHEFDL